MRAHRKLVGEVRGEQEEGKMGEVDHLQHPPVEGHPNCDDAIQATNECARYQCLNKLLHFP